MLLLLVLRQVRLWLPEKLVGASKLLVELPHAFNFCISLFFSFLFF